MKKILLFILFSNIAVYAFTQTNVNGIINTNTTWNFTNSPYIVTGNIRVNTEVTLTIEPGVIVKFNNGQNLYIDGILIGKGTINKPITFTSNQSIPNKGDWGCIYFTDYSTDVTFDANLNYTGGSILEYCVVEYAGNSSSAAINSINSSQLINNCTIRENSSVGIYIQAKAGDAIYKISNNIIKSNNGCGIKYNLPSAPGTFSTHKTIIDNNIISGNTDINGGGMNISTNELSYENGTITISRNVFLNNTATVNGAGIYVNSSHNINSTISIINNAFVGNKATNDYAIYYSHPSAVGFNFNITNNSFIANGLSALKYGVYGNYNAYSDVSSFVISKNTFKSEGFNTNGIYLSTSATVVSKIQNNNFVNLATAVYNNSSVNISASYNFWDCVSGEVPTKIYDWNDLTSLGVVDYNPISALPDTSAPILSPNGLIKKDSSNGVFLKWNKNKESDIAGYKIYYGMFDGLNFSNSIDVGSDTSYLLSGKSSSDLILISSYDNQKDGINDLLEGHESWYSNDVLPVAKIANGDSVTICQGTKVILHANKSNSCKYSWLKDGITINGANSDSLEVANLGKYQVMVTNINNVSATSDYFQVKVNQLIIQNTNSTIICGALLTLQPSISYTGNNNLVYSWDADTTISATNIKNPVANIISSHTYQVSISDSICSAKATISVTVDPLTVSANDISVSCGNSINLNAITNYTGSGDLSYIWSPALGLSDTTIKNPVVNYNKDTTYSVQVKTPNGCTASTNVNFNTSLISFNPSICMVTVNENDKNEIVWQRTANTAIDSFFIYRESYQQTDKYDLIGKLPYSAQGIFTDTSSNARVQSNKYKIATKDICGYLTSLSSEHKTMHLTINKGIGTKWNLIWESYIGQDVSSYKIYRGTSKSTLSEIGATSGSNTTYTDETAPDGVLYYVIEVILPQVCSNLISTEYSNSRSNIISTSDAVTKIPNTSIAESFIYPNPAFDKLNVKNIKSSNAVLLIFDLQGKLVLSGQIKSNQIDISTLSKGIYTVKYIDSGILMINKLVKE